MCTKDNEKKATDLTLNANFKLDSDEHTGSVKIEISGNGSANTMAEFLYRLTVTLITEAGEDAARYFTISAARSIAEKITGDDGMKPIVKISRDSLN